MGKNFFHTKKKEIVYLHIKTWVGSGTVIGAAHYYGRLTHQPGLDYKARREVEVEYAVNTKQAKKLNAEDKGDYGVLAHKYKKGDKSTRFWDEESVIAAAKAVWRKEFPEAKLLLRGDLAVMDPMPALDGDPPELLVQLNEIVAQCEAINWWEGHKDDEMQELSDKWNRLVEAGVH